MQLTDTILHNMADEAAAKDGLMALGLGDFAIQLGDIARWANENDVSLADACLLVLTDKLTFDESGKGVCGG